MDIEKLSKLSNLRTEASILACGIKAFSSMAFNYACEQEENEYFSYAFEFLEKNAENLEEILYKIDEILYKE
jgi:hypothetical protein